MVTAHGTSERALAATRARGLTVVEATCPLVRVAHRAIKALVRDGYHPVIIGQRNHVEVRGLTDDLDAFDVVLDDSDIAGLDPHPRIGVAAQTTQSIEKVRHLVELIRQWLPQSDVRFTDTVCRPTKDRQTAARDLARQSNIVVVVGGANSNNTRELVKRRIGRLAGLIVACDAMVQWCAGLIDEGYRGEMECIIAKIFGSEAQKEAAIELFMKTHGGRSFLKGHLFGDNVHEFLAPCIYEGEGEMLGMAFFKSLVKHHGQLYFEPIGRTLHQLGIPQANLANPAHLWALRKPISTYVKWFTTQGFLGSKWSSLPPMPSELASHAKFAQKMLSRSGMKISGMMRKHQLKLADRQCRMSALSLALQDAVVMLVTSLYGARNDNPTTRAAADSGDRHPAPPGSWKRPRPARPTRPRPPPSRAADRFRSR
jgi:hypothetical protein